MPEKKSFKLEDLGPIISNGVAQIINSVSFNVNPPLQPALAGNAYQKGNTPKGPNYDASCGCDKNQECQCVGFFGCTGNGCTCNTYDFMKDDCAKDGCFFTNPLPY